METSNINKRKTKGGLPEQSLSDRKVAFRLDIESCSNEGHAALDECEPISGNSVFETAEDWMEVGNTVAGPRLLVRLVWSLE